MLDARDLTKSYGNVRAADGVRFSVQRGEIFGLLGPNGAGKTTTIKMLSTVISPDEGDATISGYSIKVEPHRVRQLIGLCPQEIALYEELTAVDNMVFFGRMAGLPPREALSRAKYCLDLMGLRDRARQRIITFSGGMKRRVNLAVSLVRRPGLLFLDEPTVGVDAQSRARIYETVRSLSLEGMTVLYTTHYMEEADALCDQIAIMDEGRIIASGSPEELKARLTDHEAPTLEDVFLHLTGRTLRD